MKQNGNKWGKSQSYGGLFIHKSNQCLKEGMSCKILLEIIFAFEKSIQFLFELASIGICYFQFPAAYRY